MRIVPWAHHRRRHHTTEAAADSRLGAAQIQAAVDSFHLPDWMQNYSVHHILQVKTEVRIALCLAAPNLDVRRHTAIAPQGNCLDLAAAADTHFAEEADMLPADGTHYHRAERIQAGYCSSGKRVAPEALSDSRADWSLERSDTADHKARRMPVAADIRRVAEADSSDNLVAPTVPDNLADTAADNLPAAAGIADNPEARRIAVLDNPAVDTAEPIPAQVDLVFH